MKSPRLRHAPLVTVFSSSLMFVAPRARRKMAVRSRCGRIARAPAHRRRAGDTAPASARRALAPTRPSPPTTSRYGDRPFRTIRRRLAVLHRWLGVMPRLLPAGRVHDAGDMPGVSQHVLRSPPTCWIVRYVRTPRRDVVVFGTDHVERIDDLAQIDRRVVDGERARLDDRVMTGSTPADTASASRPASAWNRCSTRGCRTPAAACLGTSC